MVRSTKHTPARPNHRIISTIHFVVKYSLKSVNLYTQIAQLRFSLTEAEAAAKSAFGECSEVESLKVRLSIDINLILTVGYLCM